MWDRCSASLKHLKFLCDLDTQLPTTPHPASQLRLESLNLKMISRICLRDWLMHPRSPFDLSGLKALSLDSDMDMLRFQNFGPALRTIRDLTLIPANHMYTYMKPSIAVALSSFSRLVYLRICVYPYTWPWVFATLSTITVSNNIQKIVFVGDFDTTTPEEFDSQLSNLPISPIVELAINPSQYADVIPNLPRLNSNNRLRRANYEPTHEFFSDLPDMS
ncbi:hypothetical protein C8R44DRAFT_251108 [Mycena epipterygia]|nr:hypothetical protein C8R44DRAFT_251108 [Mycena epipterygia]